jgi:hypothetical protein
VLIVVLLIVATDAYRLWPAIVLAIPLLWLVHAKWSPGKRFATSLWAKLMLTPLALIVLVIGTFVPLGALQARAEGEVERLHAQIWQPAYAKAIPRLIAAEKTRMAFLGWTPKKRLRRDVLYLHGLDLMRAGSPREAIHAFEAVIGRPWDTLGPGTGLTYDTMDEDAAVKAGWCYLDLGNSARARQIFDLLVSESTTDPDRLIGLGVALQRSGDAKGARELCVRAKKEMRYPLRDYTPSQLRAVQQFLRQCP